MKPSETDLKIMRLLDGDLPNEEVAGLEAELVSSPEARENYRRLSSLHSHLETLHETLPSQVHGEIVPVERIVVRQRRRLVKVALCTAVVLVAVIAVSLFRVPFSPIASFRTQPGSVFTLTHTKEGQGTFTGKVLGVGSRLSLAKGSIEAVFQSGVRMVAEGSCELEVLDDDRVALTKGLAWFEVPKDAIGFTVETEKLIIVDLGTTFGVDALSSRPNEVHVTKGSVEVQVREESDSTKILTTKQAVRVTSSGKLEEIDFHPLRFRTSVDPNTQTLEVTNWVSLFDPQQNEPRFENETASTNAPVTTDASKDCIAANFAPVTLADGHSITLTGRVTLDAPLPGNQFRIGFFNGPPVKKDVGNAYAGIYTGAPANATTNLRYGDGSFTENPFGMGQDIYPHILRWGGAVKANTPIDFLLTITRKGSQLEVATRYTDHDAYDRSGTAKQIDILTTAPDFTYTFNTVAFLLGERISGNRATFEDIKVTVSR
jgi:hypothetical protein